MNKEIRPFSNSSEFDSWMSSNCYKCQKYDTNTDGFSTCPIENGIADGAINGVISHAIAWQMGMVKTPSGWKHTNSGCTEIEPIQKWHIMGKVNGNEAMFFGPFDSLIEAEKAFSSAPLVINEIASYSKVLSHVHDFNLFVKQTNKDVGGEISRFIVQLSDRNVKDAFIWCAKNNPAHLRSIERRDSGSQWVFNGGSTIQWQNFIGLPWTRLHKHEYKPYIHKDDCEYYYHHSNTQLGLQAFKLLSDFEEYSSIQMMEGKHGVELVSSEVVPTPTNKAWLILGAAQESSGTKHPNKLMPWTAYPGELTASVKNIPGFNGTLDCAIEAAAKGYPIAVKYHQS